MTLVPLVHTRKPKTMNLGRESAMIPTIESIVEGICDGTITKSQAVSWIYQHAEDAHRELRDEFAMSAMQGIVANDSIMETTARSVKGMGNQTYETNSHVARWSYALADALIAERNK